MSDDYNENSIDATLGRLIQRLDTMEKNWDEHRVYVWKTLEELKMEKNERVGAAAVWASVISFAISIGTIVVNEIRK